MSAAAQQALNVADSPDARSTAAEVCVARLLRRDGYDVLHINTVSEHTFRCPHCQRSLHQQSRTLRGFVETVDGRVYGPPDLLAMDPAGDRPPFYAEVKYKTAFKQWHGSVVDGAWTPNGMAAAENPEDTPRTFTAIDETELDRYLRFERSNAHMIPVLLYFVEHATGRVLRSDGPLWKFATRRTHLGNDTIRGVRVVNFDRDRALMVVSPGVRT